MENLARKFLTEEEYLEYERKAETKSEYYRGELFAMAGAKASHNIILSNLIREFSNLLRKKPCTVFPSDMRVRVSTAGLYTYPDLSIVREKPIYLDSKQDTLLNPSLILDTDFQHDHVTFTIPGFISYKSFHFGWMNAVCKHLVREKILTKNEVEQIKQRYINGFHVYFQPIKGDSNEVLFRTSEYIATGFFHNSQILKVDHVSTSSPTGSGKEMEHSVVYSSTAFREINMLRLTHDLVKGYFRLGKPP